MSTIATGEQPTGRFPRRAWVPYVALALLGASVYGPTIGFGYSYYDDHVLIKGQIDFLSDPSHIADVFYTDPFAALTPKSGGLYYRPLLWVLWIGVAGTAGDAPWAFHAANVLLHVLATCLVFALLVRLGYARATSLFLSALFCVHPVLTQAVAWIPGVNDILLAIFALLTLLALLRFLEVGSRRLLLLTVACWMLALFTKEAGIALGAVVPLLVWTRRPIRAPSSRLLALGAACIATGLVWFVLRRTALGGFPLRLSWLPSNLEMFAIYLGKTIVPHWLSVAPTLTDAPRIPGLLALGLIGAAAWSVRKGWIGLPGVGLVWYFGFLFPALLTSPAARGLEHRLYVPMIGMLILLAEIPWPPFLRSGPRARRALALAAVALLATSTVRRLPAFRSGLSFWESAVATSPHSARSWRQLATHYHFEGMQSEAEQASRRYLELQPGDTQIQVLLAAIHLRQNRVRLAKRELEAYLRSHPDDAAARDLLAMTRRRLRGDRTREAVPPAEDPATAH